jgi:hypothetical protein
MKKSRENVKIDTSEILLSENCTKYCEKLFIHLFHLRKKWRNFIYCTKYISGLKEINENWENEINCTKYMWEIVGCGGVIQDFDGNGIKATLKIRFPSTLCACTFFLFRSIKVLLFHKKWLH